MGNKLSPRIFKQIYMSKKKEEAPKYKQIYCKLKIGEYNLLFAEQNTRQLETGKRVSYSALVREAINKTYGVHGE